MTSPVRRVAASGPRARSFRDPAAVRARRRWSLVPALALLLAACTGAPRSDDRTDPAAADRPPNVVFIMADDPGIGELGAYGQEHIRRPAMDRPAAEGMRVTHHDGGSPVCTPSRAVRLTARARPHAVVRDNREVGGSSPDEPEGRMPLPPGTETSARRPQDAGYATATIGTRGLGGPDSTGMPNRRGFDLLHGHRCRRVAHDLHPTHLWRSDVREDLPPVLLDRRPAAERPFVAWEFPRYGGQEAVRMGRWKAVRRFMARGEMEIDLFDLETDPGETTVVAADHRAIAVEARRIMREERTPSPAFPMPGLDRPVARPPTANGGER